MGLPDYERGELEKTSSQTKLVKIIKKKITTLETDYRQTENSEIRMQEKVLNCDRKARVF